MVTFTLFVAKNWRVYKIFYNSRHQRNVGTNKPYFLLSLYQLYIFHLDQGYHKLSSLYHCRVCLDTIFHSSSSQNDL